ncbi:MAG: FGGY-family carbohydrate kinase [Anaerolineales bacterium]
MTTDTILSIDHGTQSVRALLFDPQGNLLAMSQVFIEPYYSTQPGWAEQDPDVFWNGVCQACQQLWQQPGVEKAGIKAVVLTTQRSTLLNVDKNGKPLRPAIVWLDQRRTEGLKPVGGLWGAAFGLVGMTETVKYLQAEAEANWLIHNQPEIWEQTYKYMFLSGYLTFKLTGRFVDSVGAQVGYVPFDYKNLTWCKPWDWKWIAAPVPKEKLVELIPPTEPLGEITPEASEATGLPVGLPLISAAADKACEVLGAGCLEPDIACLSYGTTATINTTHQKYIEPIPLIPPYPAAVPGHYSLEIQVNRGYWMVSWFKQEFGLREERIAKEKGVAPEALFDELTDAVPPGSDGLVLQPYWSPFLRNPEARGSIVGFSDVHTRAHIYRAIIEGIAYALREGAESSVKRSGVPIKALRVAGGGSQSRAAMQITADIFGLPASRPHVYEASGLGAAIVGAVASGLHPDFSTAVREMTRVSETFEPDPKNRAIYDQLYREIYKKLYKRVKPLYEKVGDILARAG